MDRHAKNLPESNSELHELPYAQDRCPGDAFKIRRSLHSHRASRPAGTELTIRVPQVSILAWDSTRAILQIGQAALLPRL